MKQLILLRIRIAGHTRQQLAPGCLLDSTRPVSSPDTVAQDAVPATPTPVAHHAVPKAGDPHHDATGIGHLPKELPAGLRENTEFHAALGLKTHQEALS
jgi:hypothetical protein